MLDQTHHRRRTSMAIGAAVTLLMVLLTAGGSSASASTTTSDGPVPDFTYECIADIITWSCSFSGSAPGSIVSWQWDFGDGTTGSGQHGFNRYEVESTYQVTLEVTDDAGRTGSVTKPVTVGA
jgi:PKD repeat protein